jgi:hypothetical protein
LGAFEPNEIQVDIAGCRCVARPSAVIFDGGLPESAISLLAPWVSYIEPPGIGAPVPELQDHGLAVLMEPCTLVFMAAILSRFIYFGG